MKRQISRQRRRIYAKAKELHIEIVFIEWESIGAGAEKTGPSGGWNVEDIHGDMYFGYNIDELLKDMESSHALLEFAGKWAGDDLEQCLDAICESRAEAEFD